MLLTAKQVIAILLKRKSGKNPAVRAELKRLLRVFDANVLNENGWMVRDERHAEIDLMLAKRSWHRGKVESRLCDYVYHLNDVTTYRAAFEYGTITLGLIEARSKLERKSSDSTADLQALGLALDDLDKILSPELTFISFLFPEYRNLLLNIIVGLVLAVTFPLSLPIAYGVLCVTRMFPHRGIDPSSITIYSGDATLRAEAEFTREPPSKETEKAFDDFVLSLKANDPISGTAVDGAQPWSVVLDEACESVKSIPLSSSDLGLQIELENRYRNYGTNGRIHGGMPPGKRTKGFMPLIDSIYALSLKRGENLVKACWYLDLIDEVSMTLAQSNRLTDAVVQQLVGAGVDAVVAADPSYNAASSRKSNADFYACRWATEFQSESRKKCDIYENDTIVAVIRGNRPDDLVNSGPKLGSAVAAATITTTSEHPKGPEAKTMDDDFLDLKKFAPNNAGWVALLDHTYLHVKNIEKLLLSEIVMRDRLADFIFLNGNDGPWDAGGPLVPAIDAIKWLADREGGNDLKKAYQYVVLLGGLQFSIREHRSLSSMWNAAVVKHLNDTIVNAIPNNKPDDLGYSRPKLG